jgi:pimeloyl-ACP methyl ester carboxylesterase
MTRTLRGETSANLGFARVDVVTSDGVRLAAFDHRPDGRSDAPVLFLVNGLGGNLVTWSHLVRRFRDTHRIATWDYRGLYASRLTPDQRRAAHRGALRLGLSAHVEDAVTVLDALGIERAVFFGWSMGVQVSFELTRHDRERMAGLVQICGASGHTTATTIIGRTGLKVIPPAMEAFRILTERHASTLSRLAGSDLALGLAKRVGLVANTLDVPLAKAIIADYMGQDFDIYNRILMGLADHDATDVLAALDVPTLVVAGTRDPMTPHHLSERMVATLPDAELLVIDGASHYLPVEFPDRLNETVASFLARRCAPSA